MESFFCLYVLNFDIIFPLYLNQIKVVKKSYSVNECKENNTVVTSFPIVNFILSILIQNRV